jgi:hypothetical protein
MSASLLSNKKPQESILWQKKNCILPVFGIKSKPFFWLAFSWPSNVHQCQALFKCQAFFKESITNEE